MLIVAIILLLLLIVLSIKYFSMKMFVLGLLHQVGVRYNWTPTEKEVAELTGYATRRKFNELFGKSNN